MLFPTPLQTAAQAMIDHKETLIIAVLARLDIIKDGEPYDMSAISKRCRFVVHGDDTLNWPKGTQILEVDGVPRLAILPYAQELRSGGDGISILKIEQAHQFL
jgi:hypothetical protein